jgi:outer membrane protein OmpA-like peptidoglycan-associated protein
VALARGASAEGAPRFALSSFEPSLAGDRFFSVPDAVVRLSTRPQGLRHGGAMGSRLAGASLALDGSGGLLIQRGERSGQEQDVIRQRWVAHLGVLVARWRRVAVEANAPLLLYQGAKEGALEQLGVGSSPGVLGDLRLSLRGALLGQPGAGAALALQVDLRLPSGDAASLHGDPEARLHPRLLLSGQRGGLSYAVNGGLLRRASQDWGTGVIGPAISFGAAAGYSVRVRPETRRLNGLQLSSDVYGSSVLSPGGGRGKLLGEGATPVEWLVGARWFEETAGATYVAIGVAGGAGLSRAPGASGWRGLVTLSFAAGDDDFPEDRDQDGIGDAMDACPPQGGPASEDPTRHGCPPRADLDGDGIPDEEDACVDRQGPRTQRRGTHGCPPPAPPPVAAAPVDRDGDGVVDGEDDCPGESGDPAGAPGRRGCPRPSVVVEEKRLALEEAIQFEHRQATLSEASIPLLEAIAGALRGHPELLLVRIEGHTDDSGDEAFNLQLSRQRAEAVRRWLVERGRVEPGRLQAEGFGRSRPLTSNESEEGRRKNRRVQLVIVQRR